MTKANVLNNEVADEVRGGGDGLSDTALALPCTTSATKAPPFVIDHNLVPPLTDAQLLQEEHQLFLDCLLPIWHKDTFISVGYWKIIATKLIYLPLLQPLNSQRLFKEKSLNQIMVVQKVRMTMGVL
jgi:hypothetical protein